LTLEKYKTAANTQKMNEQVIIDNIIEELDKKKRNCYKQKAKTLLKDEVLEYGEEEDTIDYVLFIIRELKCNKRIFLIELQNRCYYSSSLSSSSSASSIVSSSCSVTSSESNISSTSYPCP
jgi:hypothetical protein